MYQTLVGSCGIAAGNVSIRLLIRLGRKPGRIQELVGRLAIDV
jgi:hypothetical protein